MSQEKGRKEGRKDREGGKREQEVNKGREGKVEKEREEERRKRRQNENNVGARREYFLF